MYYCLLLYLCRINEELLSLTTFQEFIGSVPNPDFPANSMIYGPPRSKAYQACDPRFLGVADSKREGGDNKSKRGSVGEGSSTNILDGAYSGGIDVPARYRRVQSHRGKDKMKQFKYHGYNVII